jgi:hypothetical protein
MTVTVLQDNLSRLFYESLGAEVVDRIDTEISGITIPELVYGWKNTRKIELKGIHK